MLELHEIYKDYYVGKKPLHALKNINLSFPRQQFAAILGPSGCGKTTMLNLIGGLDHYTKGDLIIDGKSTKDFTDEDWDAYRNRRIGFVFQSYNLISHLNVVENVEMAMQLAGVSATERRTRALQALKDVGLESESHKAVNQLSGGQMQRVAIARSLVNNPDIILADEPTGALDSKTSRMVMDILREISRSRLVIMVTHNEELANEYSDRIIKLLDGELIGDSAPDNEPYVAPVEKEKNKRTSMSFWSALKSSWKNIRTKKGRTVMTSVAASFGIIGVSLVLSVSNGFQHYVDRVESGTLSVYPIGVYSNAVLINQNLDRSTPTAFPTDEKVVVKDDTSSGSMTISTEHNIITTSFLNYVQTNMVDTGYASSVIKNYNVDFHLTTEDPEGDIVKAGDTTFSAFSAMPGGSFHELLGSESFVRQYYEPIGTDSQYTTNMNQVVLIVDKYNQIDKSVLVDLGIIGSDDDVTSLDFSSIIGKQYKVFNNDEYYTQEASVNVTDALEGTHAISQYAVPTDNQVKTLYEDDSKGTTLSVVGILRVREDAVYSDLMDSGIGYTSALSDYMVNADQTSSVAQDIANNYTTDVSLSTIQTLVNSIPSGVNAQTYLSSKIDDLFTFYSPWHEADSIPVKINFSSYLSLAQNIGATFSNGYFLDAFDNMLPTGIEGLTYLEMTYSPYYSIAIFPADSHGKTMIKQAIDDYSAARDLEWQEAGQTGSSPYHIYYSDLISSITSTIGTMINLVSIVLIIFSSISLVVSSVMIGILTYTSVIERTKEIGVLRALGARKKDVGRLFQAETFIIGIFAGLIGVGFTYLVSIPINLILNHLYADAGLGSIASLNPLHALILITINVLLTMACGIIPSRAAARKDPVEALRSE